MNRLLGLLIASFCLTTSMYGGIKIDSVFNWQDSALPSSFAFDNIYNEVWGVTVNNSEIAIIGTTAGTHFFDITDLDDISEVAYIAGAAQGGQIIHRDYHDYEGYLYAVSDEGPSTLQIIDISSLPDTAFVVYDTNALFERVHNIFIDEDNDLLYACSVSDPVNQVFMSMGVYSLANPTSPTLVHQFFHPNIGHVHDAYVRDNIAYLNCGNSGLYIYDFTNPTNPIQLGNLTIYQQQGYNHSGWLSDDGQYYFFIDETHGTEVKICDVSDPADIQILDFFGTNTDPNAIAHNVLIDDSIVYISYYYDGIQLYDFRDPMNVTWFSSYGTSNRSHSNTYEGAWGVYPYFNDGKMIVSDMQTGLWVFQVSDTTQDDTNVSVVSMDDKAAVSAFLQDGYLQLHNLENGSWNSCALYNTTGQQISSWSISNTDDQLRLELPNELGAGHYFLQVVGKDETVGLKLVNRL